MSPTSSTASGPLRSTGHRGAAPVHRAALADLVARLSVLTDDLPELASIELNPVNAWTGGVDVLGADIVIQPRAGPQGHWAPQPLVTGCRVRPLAECGWSGRAPASGCEDGTHATRDSGPERALPEDLTSAITRAGYYPALVCDVVESALAGEGSVPPGPPGDDLRP